MYRQLSDKRYVHSALFKDTHEAHAALHDVEEAGLSSERLALFLLHADQVDEVAQPPVEGDGRRGLLLGLLCGAVVGLGMSLLFARLDILSGFFEQTALFGLFGGMMIGGLGGGLYGMGLVAIPSRQPKPSQKMGNCLVTAKTANLNTLLQVDDIFRKHDALAATN